MQWNAGYSESVHTFANTINTHEGGTHEEGFRAALTTVVNKYAKDKKLLKEKDANLTGDDIREGLAAVISVKVSEPQFEGQTKTKLGNTEVKSFVQKICNEQLSHWFEANPADAKTVVNKAVSSAQARIAARKARELVRRKSATDIGGLPASLPTAAPPTHASRNCMWWKVIRPVGRPRAAATRCSRRSCRCAARSSTSKKPASTGC